MNDPKKLGFNLYQSRHCAYIMYSVTTWFLKNLYVANTKATVRRLTELQILSKELFRTH